MAKSRTSFSKGNPSPRAFPPGQSGNLAGRPKLADDIHALARPHAAEAIAGLVEFMRQREDPHLAMGAMIALLDRGYGKPPVAVYAQVNGTLAVGGIDAPPRESLEEWLARRRRELAALDGPRPEPVPGESAQPPPGSSPGARGSHPEGGSSPPNGEAAAQRERPQARVAERRGAVASAGPSRTPEQEEWLRQQRRRLGIEPGRD